jgi:acetyl/propionyl-CoA carboxylase alpha subunit
LLGDKIIETALACGADGIHPGYGFLSENAAFSAACHQAGIKFIGPTAHSIETMGSKIAAKQSAKKFNVPMVPGTDSPIQDVAEAKEIAAKQASHC